jgi:hypothetical protein
VTRILSKLAVALVIGLGLIPGAVTAQSPQNLRAAALDLKAAFGAKYPAADTHLARLAALDKRLAAATAAEKPAIEADLAALAREIFAASPLLTSAPIVFASRRQYQEDHHNTETMFQTGEICTAKFKGPGALKAVDFAAHPGESSTGGKVRTILDAPDGVIRDPEVSFDGRRILFSMRRDIRDDYHIYEIGADGAGLRQLTFGSGLSDIDPLYLPDGRIVFTSTREPKYCMCNRHVMGNLFRMDADGANIHQIGKSTLHEGHAALMPDGRILYDRWEYVDRNFGDAQGLWTCNPDGTNHAVYWGNNTKCPGAVLDGQILPGIGSDQAVAVFSSCHDRPWGALAIIDRSLGIDGRAPVLRTWPADAIKYVMNGNLDTYKAVSPKYEDPYPLGDPATGRAAGKYFICSRQVGKGDEMGLALVDVFGNEVLLLAEAPGCFDPRPLAARPRPPVVPDRVRFQEATGTFYVYNVYQGTGMERVKPGAVKHIRIVESPEKRFWTHPSWPGQGLEAPAMNWHDFSSKRILGTAAVEADGSAYFEVPADRFVYFQLLDENGMMIQSMRSGTIVRPGEAAGCVGCHDNRLSAVPNDAREALGRPAQKLEGWYGPPREFSYTRDVQPVFDRYCVKCHDVGGPGAKKFTLAGDRGLAFNISYHELWAKKYITVVGAGPAEVQMPYSWGSHASKIVPRLKVDGKKIDKESIDRVVTWIDLNAPYYPAYSSVYPDNLYGRSPLDDKQLKRLAELTGVKFDGRAENDTQVNLARPDLSPCLASLKDKSDPKYAEALAIIEAGKKMLAERPREDMPGFQILGKDAEREARYQERAKIEADVRRAILAGEKIYPYKPASPVPLSSE